MAVTITIDKQDVHGTEAVITGSMTLGTYATNGVGAEASPSVATMAKALGLTTLRKFEIPALSFLGAPSAANCRLTAWDSTNGKVIAMALGGTEIANATDLSTLVVYFRGTGLR